MGEFCFRCGLPSKSPWCGTCIEGKARNTRNTASAMLLRNLNADRARDSKDLLCAAEGGDITRMAQLLATADRDTLALALWVYCCKAAEAAR